MIETNFKIISNGKYQVMRFCSQQKIKYFEDCSNSKPVKADIKSNIKKEKLRKRVFTDSSEAKE